MKKWLPLIIAFTACTQASILPPPATELGLRAGTVTAGQVNAGMLGKAATLSRPTTLLISHTTLGKPLLYMVGIIRNTDPKMRYYGAYLPRLIQFSLNGHELVMEDILPRTQFDQASHGIRKIITHFPIISDDGRTIEFDFANGMKILDTWILHEGADDLTPTLYSYIASSRTSNGTLTLDMNVQTTDNAGSNQAWVVRHIFSSSLANSTLEPRKPDETRQIGYFKIAPWYTLGSSESHEYITRWSLDRPLRFTVSANTPTPFRDGIIQGVLAWNATFGRDVFKYIEPPANYSPLNLDVDLGIHWAENDNIALAYGTLLPHPQTGEILHADIVIYSGWGKSYEGSYNNPTFQSNASQNAPDGFSPAQVCMMDDLDLASEIHATPELQDKDILQRYVTRAFSVLVRHEVGHTLGLRHNFMGTLAAEASDAFFDSAFQNFLDGKEETDIPSPSSSIMDYTPYSRDIFMPPVAIYDQAAITWGYFSRIGSIPDHPPLFCTDEDTQSNGSADCTRWDAGSEPLTYIKKSLQRDIATYVRTLFKIADYPQAQLDKTPPSSIPDAWLISKWVSMLKRYTSAQVSILSINGNHGLERRAMARAILGSYASPQTWGVPEIYTIAERLENLAHNGNHDEQFWARDVINRLNIGLQNLNSALDAQPSVNNEGSNGTTTDLHLGN